MATELRVDDLLNSFETGSTNKVNKDNKNTRQESNGWDEHEEDNNFSLGLGRNQQGASKAKSNKKKTQDKGWGEKDAGSAPQQPQVVDFSKLQETEQKKKIFNKPNGQPKQPAVVVDAEYFPSLGEERPKQAPKKPEPTSSSPTLAVEKNTSTGGVRKFVNVKKQGTGENFVPLEPVPQERVVPVVQAPVVEKVETQKPATGGFQRSTVERAAEKPVEAPVDSKFKFGGGEGPRKFMGANKVSFKREEEKSEQDLAREAKEREIEERLAREKEELAKQRENKKIGKETKETKETKDEEKGEVVEEKVEKVEQQPEEKRIARFSNSKKQVEKVEPVVEKKAEVKVEESVPEVKASHPVQNVEMNGTLSNKAWGDGPLLKKKK